MKKWSLGMKLSREFPNSIPIWIKFPNLDLDFWTPESISRIASTLGHPIRLNNVIRINVVFLLLEF